MNQTRTPSNPPSAIAPSYETKNITFRTYGVYVDAIERAAAKAGKTISDYARDILAPFAYSDLGERMPNLPAIQRGRYSSMINQAAKASGVTKEEFMQRAAQEVAARMLAESGERPAVHLTKRQG
jgi:uncharacterized protein (DUF1778 family)